MENGQISDMKRSAGSERKARGGFTLAEVTAAGAVLILLSLIAMQGVTVCGRLVERSERRRSQERALELYIAENGVPSESRDVTLLAGDLGEWEVRIGTYTAEVDGRTIVLKTLVDADEE